ncbi:hypothetical protein [Alienimonas chondri]|uniref:Uncharacterized protein n=1 Tax=Alienimonas chondri TaxID=2681879 RepID=A0ABX1VII8_9PLAN|nr:hypothetical protein [Alienimonas chondri]NNJ27047.1 hypothetical protein [Alienimonas chondri]
MLRRSHFVRSSGLRLVGAGGALLIAFCAGRLSDAPVMPVAEAQEEAIDESIVARIKEGFEGLRRAQVALEQSGRYVPAANGVNSFIVLAGGYDVLNSLETGRGVDPETYAALEAGFAPQHVLSELGRDENGRLTYKKELVRLMSRETLRTLYLRRGEVLGEAL